MSLSGLRKANDLENEKLYVHLLQPPLDRAGCIADLPSDEGSRQPIICPDVLRAALSGSVNRVIELLGLEDQITYDARGHIFYSDYLCLLGEVTAKNNTMLRTVLRMAAERVHAEFEKIILLRNRRFASENHHRHIWEEIY